MDYYKMHFISCTTKLLKIRVPLWPSAFYYRLWLLAASLFSSCIYSYNISELQKHKRNKVEENIKSKESRTVAISYQNSKHYILLHITTLCGNVKSPSGSHELQSWDVFILQFLQQSNLKFYNMQLLNFIIHSIAAACYGYSIYYDNSYVNIPGREKYGGRLKFLTYWNLVSFDRQLLLLAQL